MLASLAEQKITCHDYKISGFKFIAEVLDYRGMAAVVVRMYGYILAPVIFCIALEWQLSDALFLANSGN